MLKYILVSSAVAAVSAAYTLITACNNSNLSGNCITWTGDLNTCYGVTEYNDAISSVKVYGGIYCRLYRDAGCQGEGPLIIGPAYNLNDQGFNDVTSSFYCYLN